MLNSRGGETLSMSTILITGGTGLIGRGLVKALLLGDEKIRLLSRGALEDSEEFPSDRVEPFPGNVADRDSLAGAADGCDVVVHIAGIAEEDPPDLTFERINVEGTRALLEECRRAGVRRFIHISSLGAERGQSPYHRSKYKSEEIVREFEGEWLILRPGNVYGPGDTVISELMTMVRTLPVVPIINAGDQEFQPIWYEDLANAIARAIRRDGPWHRTLELAGSERTTMTQLIDRICELTDRHPARAPIPDFLAEFAAKLGRSTGVEPPIDENKLTMLLEENVIRAPNSNALVGVFEIDPLPLENGLRILIDSLPEQTPDEGVGPLEHKVFRIEIIESGLTPAQLMDRFRQNATDVMDVRFGVEPGAYDRIEPGATLTGELPMRGRFQVRVEESEPERVTLGTVQGHPLAGIVQFRTEHTARGLAFVVDIYARISSTFDRLAIKSVGWVAQDANWRHVCERMADLSGGEAPEGVTTEKTTLDDEAAKEVEDWIATMIRMRHRRGEEPAVRE